MLESFENVCRLESCFCLRMYHSANASFLYYVIGYEYYSLYPFLH